MTSITIRQAGKRASQCERARGIVIDPRNSRPKHCPPLTDLQLSFTYIYASLRALAPSFVSSSLARTIFAIPSLLSSSSCLLLLAWVAPWIIHRPLFAFSLSLSLSLSLPRTRLFFFFVFLALLASVLLGETERALAHAVEWFAILFVSRIAALSRADPRRGGQREVLGARSESRKYFYDRKEWHCGRLFSYTAGHRRRPGSYLFVLFTRRWIIET